ncbi:uncharacterized protein DUF5300 [Natranaerovirga pectinivora]|uniref:Uncharacterized protein DUF5300 n=1 Tax=Natranaerovirga pectinivora TaxID=682400 RepID=A0A4V2V0E8_9FIRM|nr:DUF5301 domain-containing protein [Natranaerovirga pectinivora]TCT15620.1 uncharacterized protein DUF5300 [Natranaerovirga pectinivora]
MKKTKLRWVGSFIVVLFIVVAIGAIILYNHFFPMAESIQYPSIETISAIEITNNNLEKKYTDNETIETISQYFLNAKATRTLSISDNPTKEEYYIVNIIAEDDSRLYKSYIYKENSKWYIEQPYWGVYRIDKDMLPFLENDN